MGVLVSGYFCSPSMALIRSSPTNKTPSLSTLVGNRAPKPKIGLLSRLLYCFRTADNRTKFPKTKVPLQFIAAAIWVHCRTWWEWMDPHSLSNILLRAHDVPDTVLQFGKQQHAVICHFDYTPMLWYSPALLQATFFSGFFAKWLLVRLQPMGGNQWERSRKPEYFSFTLFCW